MSNADKALATPKDYSLLTTGAEHHNANTLASLYLQMSLLQITFQQIFLVCSMYQPFNMNMN